MVKGNILADDKAVIERESDNNFAPELFIISITNGFKRFILRF